MFVHSVINLLLLIRTICDIADTQCIVVKSKSLSSGPKLNFHILWDGIDGWFIATIHDTSSSIGTSGRVSTVYVQHPIRMGPGEDSPLLDLWLERWIGIPVSHHTRLGQRNVGYGEDHWSRAGVVSTATVRDVVNPAPSFRDKLITLAGEVIEAARPALLSTIQTSQDPPLSPGLSHISEIPYPVCVVG